MILRFLSDLAGSIFILSLVFLMAIIVEYKFGLIGQVVDVGNNVMNTLNPVNWFNMNNMNFGNMNNMNNMNFNNIQGFENPPDVMNAINDAFGTNEQSKLSPGNAFSNSSEKLLSDFIPIQSDSEAQNAWSKIPSETCLKYDDGEKLKPLANYYQRTNNYIRTHPDDCSAPFHEMVGTFYKPTLGVGKTAPSGLPLPGSVVSCNGSKSNIVGNSSDFTKSLIE
jgi:hypothetical protein